MFLSVKEMELRKVRFEETFQPGRIDFSGEDVEQNSPLRAAGTAELLAHSDGEVRIRGNYCVELRAQCDRCLGDARFPLDGSFDLYYRPVSAIAREEEVEIDEGETRDRLLRRRRPGTGGYPSGAGAVGLAHAAGLQRGLQRNLSGLREETGTRRACDCRATNAGDRWEPLRKLESLSHSDIDTAQADEIC